MSEDPIRTASSGKSIWELAKIIPGLPAAKKIGFALGISTEAGLRVYAKTNLAKDLARARSKVRDSYVDNLIAGNANTESVISAVGSDFIDGLFQREINKASVASEAVLILDRSMIVRDERSKEDKGIDEDWAANFEREAELANSDELRKRMAQILAQEVSHPGTISKSTIRWVSEASKTKIEIAKKLSIRQFGTNLLYSYIPNSGDDFQDLVRAQSYGLISEISRQMFATPTETAFGYRILQCKGRGSPRLIFLLGEPGFDVRIPCLALTEVGAEVLSILDEHDWIQKSKFLADQIPKRGLHRITAINATEMTENPFHPSSLPAVWSSVVD